MRSRRRNLLGRSSGSLLLLFSSTRVAAPIIRLSGLSIAEDASSGTVVGTLSVANGSGSYTFSITADPDSKFAIDGSNLETAAALNYEVATSHSVTIEADNGVDDPISRVFIIPVLNVLEVTLSALTLNNDDIEEGSAPGTVVGALQSVSSGSTLSLIDDAGGRFALSGSNVVAGLVATDYDAATSHDITVRETHADGSNSPRDTILTINVTEEGAAPTYIPTYHYLGF
jgi:hypothetical protein